MISNRDLSLVRRLIGGGGSDEIIRVPALLLPTIDARDMWRWKAQTNQGVLTNTGGGTIAIYNAWEDGLYQIFGTIIRDTASAAVTLVSGALFDGTSNKIEGSDFLIGRLPTAAGSELRIPHPLVLWMKNGWGPRLGQDSATGVGESIRAFVTIYQLFVP